MLDLDSIAEKRADSLHEKREAWNQVVWTADFQALSANMSDGEVLTLLEHCNSYRQVEAVVRFLVAQQAVRTPYVSLVDAAKAAGLALGEWIAQL